MCAHLFDESRGDLVLLYFILSHLFPLFMRSEEKGIEDFGKGQPSEKTQRRLVWHCKVTDNELALNSSSFQRLEPSFCPVLLFAIYNITPIPKPSLRAVFEKA